MNTSLRVLYLHGFASVPWTHKAREITRLLAEHGVTVEAPDMNVPSFESLSVRAQCAMVRAMLDADPRDAVLVGSSLGGYVAAMLAPRRPHETGEPGHPRVKGLVLLAPAFDLAARWHKRLGTEGVAKWRREGTASFVHHDGNRERRVGVGLLDEVDALPARPGTHVPVTVLQGRRDASVAFTGTRAWVEENPHSTYIEVDDEHQLLANIERTVDEVRRMLSVVQHYAGGA